MEYRMRCVGKGVGWLLVYVVLFLLMIGELRDVICSVVDRFLIMFSLLQIFLCPGFVQTAEHTISRYVNH